MALNLFQLSSSSTQKPEHLLKQKRFPFQYLLYLTHNLCHTAQRDIKLYSGTINDEHVLSMLVCSVETQMEVQFVFLSWVAHVLRSQLCLWCDLANVCNKKTNARNLPRRRLVWKIYELLFPEKGYSIQPSNNNPTKTMEQMNKLWEQILISCPWYQFFLLHVMCGALKKKNTIQGTESIQNSN